MLSGLSLCGMILTGLDAPESNTPQPTAQSERTAKPSSSSAAQEATVTFLSGRKITGLMISSDDESVVLRINGIDTTYRRSRIASIKVLPPIEDRYLILRESLPDSDIDGRLLLVDWLRDRRAYELAIQELDSILEVEPNHPQAKTLKTWLEQHLKLAQSRSERKPKQATPNRRPVKATEPTLTAEQINLIRVYEIDLDNPPKFIIDNDTIRELIARSPEKFPVDEKAREAILDGTDLDKLKLLFRHRARDLYQKVRILEDPDSFKDFKQHIAGKTGWMINSCATVRCHGGENAGELRLISYNPNSPESLYSNFVIIDQFKLKDGSPLINHTEPDRSPLVHLGMVRSRSLYPHPELDPTKFGRDWKPVFRSTNATNFKRTTEWIRSLYTPRPDYGFNYPLQPATPNTDPGEPPTSPEP